ncbi:MAG TPA: CoA-transferase [Candidatus Hydrogenedentes bacterium]|nr:CoA-transferase [Candidatus Hydrogenedentota bacterium]HPG67151.1 CoA-transferase [Candidatus Hydrogenedentota bacterium]
MNILTKAYVAQHVLRWRLTWDCRDTRKRVTVAGNPKFVGPRDAVGLIRDGDVVAFSGLAGNQRPAIMYWAIREVFEETGHPRDLDLLAIGGIGGRGRVPGSLEELGQEGLVKRFISGHMETFKAFLRLADKGKVELQCLPQGVLALLLDAQMRGEDSISLRTGVGTFIDPRVGRGSPLTNGHAEQWVSIEGDRLRYRIPKINVAIFNAPAADREGNIYVRRCAMIGESREIARAARRNGGKVIVNVGLVVDKGYGEVFLPADEVDAIVVFKGTEQTVTVPHRRHWSLFSTESSLPIDKALALTKQVSNMMGITPRRTPADYVLARLAARLFAEHSHKGAYVNIGVGLPEEVCRLMYEGGLLDDITLLTESGVLGGVPTPGVFFGAEACPKQIISSPEVFKLCYEKLDVTVLGVVQADSQGNVNVSKRGDGAINYVGPGGFIDLTTAAKMVIFVSSWMDKAVYNVRDGKVRVAQPGTPKFIDHVDEITFSGAEAVRAGKKVFYATHVGAFQLTERGMELIRVMPGIDIRKDILGVSPMKVILPESGNVPLVTLPIVTGDGFRLVLE